MWEFFKEGGYGMIPIAVCSVFILGIIIERAIFLNGAAINRDMFVQRMQKAIFAGDLPRAVKDCSSLDAPMARIIQAGLVKVNRPDDEIFAALEEATTHELPKIGARTGYLAMLSNIAMLCALAGTVWGLIKSFGSVSGEDIESSQKAAILAAGISEAMHCTFFGLVVAVFGLIGFAFLNGQTQSIEDDINEASIRIYNLVITNRATLTQGQPAAPRPAP